LQAIPGFEECVKLLVEKNANLKHRDKLGKSVFHHAAICGQARVLEELLENLDKPTSVQHLEDIDGCET
jgi:ankyrin repeat protein